MTTEVVVVPTHPTNVVSVQTSLGGAKGDKGETGPAGPAGPAGANGSARPPGSCWSSRCYTPNYFVRDKHKRDYWYQPIAVVYYEQPSEWFGYLSHDGYDERFEHHFGYVAERPLVWCGVVGVIEHFHWTNADGESLWCSRNVD